MDDEDEFYENFDPETIEPLNWFDVGFLALAPILGLIGGIEYMLKGFAGALRVESLRRDRNRIAVREFVADVEKM